MDYFKLLILGAAFSAPAAHSFSGSLTPPPGWTAASTGMANATIRADLAAAQAITNASNSAQTALKFRAALSIGAESLAVPVTARMITPGLVLGARFALAATGVGLVGLAALVALPPFLDYLNELDKSRHLQYNPSTGKWVKVMQTSMTLYYVNGSGLQGSPDEACRLSGGTDIIIIPSDQISPGDNLFAACYDNGSNIGNIRTEVGIGGKAEPQDYLKDVLPVIEKQPIPPDLPAATPYDWPVELPKLTPPLDPFAEPAPLEIPIGSPTGGVQPGVEITPKGTTAQPWAVDIKPIDNVKVTVDPTKSVDPTVTPSTLPSSSPTPPTPGLCDQYPNIEACGPVKKKFCEEYPESLICKDLDIPDAENIEEKTKSISVSPDSGWFSGSGSCPASITLKAGGAEFSYKPYCDFLTGMRPVIIAAAWLAAAFILIGAKES